MNGTSEVVAENVAKKDSFASLAIYSLMALSVVGLIFSIAVSSIAMGAALILFVYFVFKSGGTAFPRTQLDLFFLLYVVAELLASIFSIEPGASFFNMKRLFLISFVYLALVAIDNESKLKTVLGLLIGVTSLLSLIELFSLTSIAGHYMRVSIFQYYMTEGGIKMITLLLLLPFIIHPATPRSWRILTIIGSLPILTGLILTQTRSSWLGFMSGVIAIGILKSKKTIIVLLLFVFLFLLFAPSDFRNRAKSIVDPANRSNLSRIHMLTTGWRMFLDRPVVGVGDIDLKKLYVTYIEPLEEGEGGHLHNNFIMLLVTLGIVGFAAIMILFIKVFQAEIKAFRSTNSHWLFGSITLGCFASYIGFHVNGLFEWNFGDHEIAVLLWFTVGISLVSEKLFHRLKNQGSN
jgi:O-antigen ligase